MTAFIKNEKGLYEISGTVRPEDIVQLAAHILIDGISQSGQLTRPTDAAQFLQFKLANEDHENFAALFLDSKHKVITYKKLFTGTIDSAAVYPRVVVKAALACNAAAVILAHNHPSNDCEPSTADRAITKRLADALGLLDIRVLDHIVVTKSDWVSLAERGWV